MSIEPQCLYCNACDKFRCKTQDQADTCDAYVRIQARRRLGRNPPPEPRKVTMAEIDAAIETLKKVKQGLT